MPAIRHLFNASSPSAGPTIYSAKHPVEVAGKDGRPVRCDWLGFVCLTGTRHIPGKMVKVFAIRVSADDGGPTSKWKEVRHDQRVLGWAVPGHDGWKKFGVYGIVDMHGWPIVIEDQLPPGLPPKVEVTPIKLVDPHEGRQAG